MRTRAARPYRPLSARDGRRLPAAILAVCLVLAIAAVNLAGEVFEAVTEAQGVSLLDRPALDWAIAQRTPALTAFVAWYSNTGGPRLLRQHGPVSAGSGRGCHGHRASVASCRSCRNRRVLGALGWRAAATREVVDGTHLRNSRSVDVLACRPRPPAA